VLAPNLVFLRAISRVLSVLSGEPFGFISRRVAEFAEEAQRISNQASPTFFISWRITQVKELALLGVAFYLRFTASANIAAGRAKEYRFRNPDLATGVLGFVHEIQV